jgi:hypothetical protein
MPRTKDWLSKSRTDQLNMSRNWVRILQSFVPVQDDASNNGDSPIKVSTAWGIPDANVEELQALVSAAQTALATAQNGETRNHITTTQCRSAFAAMIAAMRDMKNRYFYVPPLRESDLIALGLKIYDSRHSRSGTPTAQVGVETYLIGRHQLGIKINYLIGSPDDPANKSYRIWYSVIAPGGTAPTTPAELRESFSTERRRVVIDFAFDDSGKAVWLAVQIENGSKKGNWGPLISAIIP